MVSIGPYVPGGKTSPGSDMFLYKHTQTKVITHLAKPSVTQANNLIYREKLYEVWDWRIPGSNQGLPLN